MSSAPARRTQPKPEPVSRLAPAFDRDSVALVFLYEHRLISREEVRGNLRVLGLQLDESKDPERRLAVPQVVRLTDQREPERPGPFPPRPDDEEPWDPWADQAEET